VVDPGDHGAAPLGQRRLHAELVVVAVQIVDILRDDLAFKILPRPVSNTIAGVDGLCAARCLGAEIGTPGLAARTHRLRQYILFQNTDKLLLGVKWQLGFCHGSSFRRLIRPESYPEPAVRAMPPPNDVSTDRGCSAARFASLPASCLMQRLGHLKKRSIRSCPLF